MLDSGALILLESPGKRRKLTETIERMSSEGRIVISAGCIAEVWRGSPRQTPLALLLRRRTTLVEEITTAVAKAIGLFLCRRTKADDIVDAHVVMLANHYRVAVMTSDPGDLLTIDPRLDIIQV